MTGSDPEDPRLTAALAPGGPLSLGQVVELGVAVFTRRWSAALGLALLFVAPGAIVATAFGMRFNSVAMDLLPGLGEGVMDGTARLTAVQVERLIGAVSAYVGATLVAGVLGSIGAVALSRLVAGELGVRSGGLGGAIRSALHRTPSVIGFGLVTGAIILSLAVAALLAVLVILSVWPLGAQGGPGAFGALIVGVAIVAAVVYLSLRWATAFAVMAFEDAGWRPALARSWELSSDQVRRVFVIVTLGTVASLLLSALVVQLLSIVFIDWAAPTFGLDSGVIETLVVTAGAVVVAPLTPMLVAALYVDLRRRRLEELPSGPGAEVGSGPHGA